MKNRLLTLLTTFFFSFSLYAQNEQQRLEQELQNFFTNYQTVYANIGDCKLKELSIDTSEKKLVITTNPNFGYQPFTPENISAIYRSVKQILPRAYRKYKVTIVADNRPIEELVPNSLNRKKDITRLWGDIDYQGAPWTQNISRPYKAEKG